MTPENLSDYLDPTKRKALLAGLPQSKRELLNELCRKLANRLSETAVWSSLANRRPELKEPKQPNGQSVLEYILSHRNLTKQNRAKIHELLFIKEKSCTLSGFLAGIFASMYLRSYPNIPNDRLLPEAIAKLQTMIMREAHDQDCEMDWADTFGARVNDSLLNDALKELVARHMISLERSETGSEAYGTIHFNFRDRCSTDKLIEEFPLGPEFLAKIIGEFLHAHEKLSHNSA